MVERLAELNHSRREVLTRIGEVVGGEQGKTGRKVRKMVEEHLSREIVRLSEFEYYIPSRVLVKDYRNRNKAYLEIGNESPRILIYQEADDDGEPTPWEPKDEEWIELGPLAIREFHHAINEYEQRKREQEIEIFEAAFGPDGNFR